MATARTSIGVPASRTGTGASVAFDGDTLAPPDETPRVLLPDGWAITPGLVDLQVNGMGEAFPLQDPSSLPDLDRMLAEAGVTGYLVAIPSADPGQVRDLAAAAEAFAREPASGLIGLHLEGPVLSPEHRGAHAAEHLRDGDDPEARALLDLPGVRLVTIAPEVPGAMAYAAEALARGISVAAGHTGASAEQAHAAIGAGVTLATHLFNAMTPVHQRAPGAALAYLVDRRSRVACIADGAHLHDDVVELILTTAGPRALLVSDVAPHGGVHPDHPGLAGSAATLADGVRRVATVHARGIATAARLGSERPAAAIGEANRGRLEPGARADLTIWDADLRVAATIRGGRVVFGSDALGL
jgi:N-acetylglucosamine-6-phosphate deacetylase